MSFTVNSSATFPDLARTNLRQENGDYQVPMTDFRVFDDLTSILPGTAAADDLGLIGGTHGSASPGLQTGDLKAAGSTTRKARFLFTLPPEYVAAEEVQVRIHAGMETTVSDTSAEVDVTAYRGDTELGISADLVNDAAQSINSLTYATKVFDLTSTALNPGDVLDVVVSVTVNDSGTGTAVIGSIGAVTVRCKVKG